jgi:trehalose dimycolate hydrolase
MLPRCRRSQCATGTRAAGRWAAPAGAVFIAISLNVAPAGAPVASADDCADAEVVFARGTDEPKGMGHVGDDFVDSLRKQAIGMNIASYPVNYDAGKLQLHGGDGAKDAISHIKSTVAACPNTQIVLGGYSQGASVINIVSGISMGGITWGDPLPSALTNNVAAVATFGNVANRTGETLPSQSGLFAGKAIDLCNPADPICHAGPGNAWSGHTEGYVPAYTNQAAAFVASKLLAGTSQTVPGFGQTLPGYGPQAPGYGQSPGYATPPPGDQHMPPGYMPSTPAYGQSPGNDLSAPGPGSQAPGYNSSAPAYDPSFVAGLP